MLGVGAGLDVGLGLDVGVGLDVGLGLDIGLAGGLDLCDGFRAWSRPCPRPWCGPVPEEFARVVGASAPVMITTLPTGTRPSGRTEITLPGATR